MKVEADNRNLRCLLLPFFFFAFMISYHELQPAAAKKEGFLATVGVWDIIH